VETEKVVENCLKRIGNRYLLVVLAAKRAWQLVQGNERLIETKRTKPTTIALEEIAAGEVIIEKDGKKA